MKKKKGGGLTKYDVQAKIAEKIPGYEKINTNIASPQARKKMSQIYDSTCPPHATESDMRMTPMRN